MTPNVMPFKKSFFFSMILALLVLAAGCSDDAEESDTGTQRDEPAHIGLLVNIDAGLEENLVREYLDGVFVNPIVAAFAQRGYEQDENIRYTLVLPVVMSLEEAAQELVAAAPDIIILGGVGEYRALAPIEHDIPMILLVQESNITGDIQTALEDDSINMTALVLPSAHDRRFAFLMQTAPRIERLLVIHRRDRDGMITELERVAPAYNVELLPLVFEDDPVTVLSQIPDDIDGIFIDADSNNITIQLAEIALERRIPFTAINVLPQPGLLMSYGVEPVDYADDLARLGVQIIEGTPARSLPRELVDANLYIHLGTAEAIGIEVPEEVLDQAATVFTDEVVLVDENLPDTGFCTATLDAGVIQASICVTISCSQLADEAPISYTDKSAVDSCGDAGLLGLCQEATRSTYFYSGNTAIFESNCPGEWISSTESAAE